MSKFMEVVGKPLKGMDVSLYQGSREGGKLFPVKWEGEGKEKAASGYGLSNLQQNNLKCKILVVNGFFYGKNEDAGSDILSDIRTYQVK